jgi:hypothetical protein
MSSKDNSVKLDKNQVSTLQRNSAAAGTTPSAMVGRMIDDKFGGRSVGKQSGTSIKEVQKQVDSLEKLLKSKK